jgi:hypothetical protein
MWSQRVERTLRALLVAGALSCTFGIALANDLVLQPDGADPVVSEAASATSGTDPQAQNQAPTEEEENGLQEPTLESAAEVNPQPHNEDENGAGGLDGSATIVFFRPGALTGAIYDYHVVAVGEDGDSGPDSPRIGTLPNGSFFVYEAPPGIHFFNLRGPMAVNLNEDRVRIEAAPGGTYYVQQSVRIGVLTGGFRLVPSTREAFERRRLREWNPSG